MIPSSGDRCQRGHDPVLREDGSVEIPLTKGQISIVDADSYLLARDRRWCAQWDRYTKSFRATSRVGHHGVFLQLHRVVAGAPDGMIIDHINHNTLDNRRANLRIATKAENNYNSRRRTDNISGYKGVSWKRRDSRWQASIRADGKLRHLGYFRTAEDAARAYDSAARELHGAFALTNEGTPA